jgi:hypothetical protein
MSSRFLCRAALAACLVLAVGLAADAMIPADNGFLGYDDARTSVSPELTENVGWFPGRGIYRACRRVHQRRLQRGVAVFGQRRYNASCSSCAPSVQYQYVQPRYVQPAPNVVYDYPNQVVNIGAGGTCNPNCPYCGGRGCQGQCQCPPTCYTLPNGAKVCVPCRQPAAAQAPAVVQTIGATAEASPATPIAADKLNAELIAQVAMLKKELDELRKKLAYEPPLAPAVR